MRKSSAHSSRGSGTGPKSSFKKSDSFKAAPKDARPFKKKNYDGRPPAAGPASDGGRVRGAKPYSGRVTDSDRPKRAYGSDKPDRDGSGSRPSKPYDKPREDRGDRKPFSDRPKRTFDKPREERGERKSFEDRPKRTFDKPSFRKDDNKEGGSFKPREDRGDRKPFSDRPKRAFDKSGTGSDGPRDGKERKPRFNKEGGSGSRDFENPRKSTDSRPFRDRPKRPADKAGFGKPRAAKDFDTIGEPEIEKPTFGDVLDRAFKTPKARKPDDHPGKRQVFEDKVFGELAEPDPESRPKKPFEKKKSEAPGKKKFIHDHSEGRKKKYKDDEDEDDFDEEDKEINQKSGPRLEMPLNKYISHSGECSRRDAAELVRQGKVKVNAELVLDPGYKVKHDDKVTLSGKKLTPQKGNVYILLNKPKGFITTNDDPQGRRTVMDLVGNSGVERLFPVGRLDRDTSGLLLITNDGDLTQKLCHPAYEVKKVYQVTLDKAVTKADFEKIIAGVDLEDGIAKVDELAYLEKKNELGLEIHSGKNRIVRRIFESLGYVVEKLDRVMYAGLTKKNLPRSKWRYLDEREVVLLKHFKS